LGVVGEYKDDLECRLESAPLAFARGVANDKSFFEACRLCLGVRGDEGILDVEISVGRLMSCPL
jgi:hypothetical protein